MARSGNIGATLLAAGIVGRRMRTQEEAARRPTVENPQPGMGVPLTYNNMTGTATGYPNTNPTNFRIAGSPAPPPMAPPVVPPAYRARPDRPMPLQEPTAVVAPSGEVIPVTGNGTLSQANVGRPAWAPGAPIRNATESAIDTTGAGTGLSMNGPVGAPSAPAYDANYWDTQVQQDADLATIRPSYIEARDAAQQRYREADLALNRDIYMAEGNAVGAEAMQRELTLLRNPNATPEQIAADQDAMRAAPRRTQAEIALADEQLDQLRVQWQQLDAIVEQVGGTATNEDRSLVGQVFTGLDYLRGEVAEQAGGYLHIAASNPDAEPDAGWFYSLSNAIGFGPGEWVEFATQHRQQIEQAYQYGYDSDGDGKADFTGDRAVWEYFASTQNLAQRMGYDTAMDPLNYLGLVAGGGRVAGAGANALDAAGHPIIAGVLRGAQAASEVPYNVLERPFDVVTEGAGRLIRGTKPGRYASTPMSESQFQADNAGMQRVVPTIYGRAVDTSNPYLVSPPPTVTPGAPGGPTAQPPTNPPPANGYQNSSMYPTPPPNAPTPAPPPVTTPATPFTPAPTEEEVYFNQVLQRTTAQDAQGPGGIRVANANADAAVARIVARGETPSPMTIQREAGVTPIQAQEAFQRYVRTSRMTPPDEAIPSPEVVPEEAAPVPEAVVVPEPEPEPWRTSDDVPARQRGGDNRRIKFDYLVGDGEDILVVRRTTDGYAVLDANDPDISYGGPYKNQTDAIDVAADILFNERASRTTPATDTSRTPGQPLGEEVVPPTVPQEPIVRPGETIGGSPLDDVALPPPEAPMPGDYPAGAVRTSFREVADDLETAVATGQPPSLRLARKPHEQANRLHRLVTEPWSTTTADQEALLDRTPNNVRGTAIKPTASDPGERAPALIDRVIDNPTPPEALAQRRYVLAVDAHAALNPDAIADEGFKDALRRAEAIQQSLADPVPTARIPSPASSDPLERYVGRLDSPAMHLAAQGVPVGTERVRAILDEGVPVPEFPNTPIEGGDTPWNVGDIRTGQQALDRPPDEPLMSMEEADRISNAGVERAESVAPINITDRINQKYVNHIAVDPELQRAADAMVDRNVADARRAQIRVLDPAAEEGADLMGDVGPGIGHPDDPSYSQEAARSWEASATDDVMPTLPEVDTVPGSGGNLDTGTVGFAVVPENRGGIPAFSRELTKQRSRRGYDAVVQGGNAVDLLDGRIVGEDLLAIVNQKFGTGETWWDFVDARRVQHQMKLSGGSPPGALTTTAQFEKAVDLALHDWAEKLRLERNLSVKGRGGKLKRPPRTGKMGTVKNVGEAIRLLLIDLPRDIILYNNPRSIARIYMQTLGTTVQMLADRDYVPAFQYLAANASPVKAFSKAVTMPKEMRLMAEANGWVRPLSESVVTDQLTGSGALAPQRILEAIGVPRGMASFVGNVVANRHVRDIANARDNGGRAFLGTDFIRSELVGAKRGLIDAGYKYAERNLAHVPNAGEVIDQTIENLWVKNGRKGMTVDELSTAIRDALTKEGAGIRARNAGIRLSRDWDNAHNRILNGAKAKNQRVLFAGPQTRADAAIGNILLFNFFFARQTKFMMRQAIANPGMTRAVMAAVQSDYAEAKSRNAPPWLQNFYKVMDKYGAELWFSPVSLVGTYLFFRDQADNDEDATWLSRRMNSAIGSAFVIAPGIEWALNMSGALGDDPIADPFGLPILWNTIKIVTNGVKGVGGAPAGGPVTGSPIDNIWRRARAVFSGQIPGTENVPYVPSGGTEEARFIATISQVAREHGWTEEAIATDLTKPDSQLMGLAEDTEIYDEAYDRYTLAEEIIFGVKATSPVGSGAVYGTNSYWEDMKRVANGDAVLLPDGTIVDADTVMPVAVGSDGQPLSVNQEGPITGEIPGFEMNPGYNPYADGTLTQQDMDFLRAYKEAYGVWLSPGDFETMDADRRAVEAQKEAAQAGSPAVRDLTGDFYEAESLGTPTSRYAYNRWNGIAFGYVSTPVTIAGTRYSPESIASLQATPEGKKTASAMADLWAEEQGLTEDIDRHRDAVEGFRALHPQYDDYKSWQKVMRENPAGPVAWYETAALDNPSAAAYLSEAREQAGTDQALLTDLLNGTAAYYAILGDRRTVYDPERPPSNDSDAGSLVATPGGLSSQGTTGSASGAAESGSGGAGSVAGSEPNYGNRIVNDLAEYERDMVLVRSIIGTDLDNLFGYYREAAENGLKMMGVDVPTLSQETQDYLRWAQNQPPGANPTPAEFDRQQESAIQPYEDYWAQGGPFGGASWGGGGQTAPVDPFGLQGTQVVAPAPSAAPVDPAAAGRDLYGYLFGS